RSTQTLHLLASAAAKASVYRDRYDLIRQRLMRLDAFQPQGRDADNDEGDYFKITRIKDLQGSPTGQYLLFGMLTQMEEGKYHLEDPDAYIELDFSRKKDQGTGLFTLNCFALVEGYYTDERIFRVSVLGSPIPEPRKKSLAAFGGNVDFFGGRRETDDFATLRKIEREHTDVTFAILSDVWLDSPTVLHKLRTIFDGFSQAILPLAFVLIGSFISSPYIFNSSDPQKYKEGFDTLANLIAEYPEIATKCHFIFVPGPNDPVGGTVLPRPAIPNFFTSRIRNKVPNAVFTSNPARIKYCTQEIVIFREDLLKKMRRNSIV
ncbi:DNA polymerase alpha/epsilon subunit B-domain-containing protein, partial [Blyttiomyces helicus]